MTSSERNASFNSLISGRFQRKCYMLSSLYGVSDGF